MTIAIVGIAGVGKEYVREFHDKTDLVLVDFSHVFQRELRNDSLTNRFPGHEFTVSVKGARAVAVEDYSSDELLSLLTLAGVEAVIFATPPTYLGRSLFRAYLNAGQVTHLHVEKPFLWPNYRPQRNEHMVDPLYETSVGYLYHDLTAEHEVSIEAPRQEGWRDQFGIIWDLLGHVISVCPHEYRPLLRPTVMEEDRVVVEAPGLWEGRAAYVSSRLPVFQVDGAEVSWDTQFGIQADHILNERSALLCSVDEAVNIEQHLTAFSLWRAN